MFIYFIIVSEYILLKCLYLLNDYINMSDYICFFLRVDKIKFYLLFKKNNISNCNLMMYHLY